MTGGRIDRVLLGDVVDAVLDSWPARAWRHGVAEHPVGLRTAVALGVAVAVGAVQAPGPATSGAQAGLWALVTGVACAQATVPRPGARARPVLRELLVVGAVAVAVLARGPVRAGAVTGRDVTLAAVASLAVVGVRAALSARVPPPAVPTTVTRDG